MSEPTHVDLLLIGKTGNGKSAAGNSILRRKAFKSRSSTSSVTLTVDYEVSDFNGRVIKVVDGPGVGDTRMNTEKAVNLMLGTMEYAIAANPRGYHAFCLVVRFGGRFTEEDKDTIAFLKKIFGHDFVKNFCILVLTCGDNFEKESEDSGQTFEEWCKEQEGVFKDLLRECDNRIVLFDNATKDERKKKEQVGKLLEIVDNLSSHGKRYTDENFQKAKEARDRIIVEAQIPMIQEETMKETSLILQQLQDIQLEEDIEKKIKRLEHLQIRAENLMSTITSRDRGTGALHELSSTVRSIGRSVSDEIKFCYRMKEEKEKIRKHEEEIRRKYEEQMKKQKEEYERRKREDARVLEEIKKFEMEQQKMRMENEKKNKEEKEEMERKLKREMLEDQKKRDKEYEALDLEYRKVKAENDKVILSKLVDSATWPFRNFYRKHALSSCQSDEPSTRRPRNQ